MPNTSIAAPTAASAPYNSVVVTRSWAMSACSCSSVAPYSALPNPPKSAVPSSTVISLAAQVAVGDLVIVQSAKRFPDAVATPSSVQSLSALPDGGVCAYNVHPRSSGATATVEVFATPRSPIAMAISARCSTARRIEACSGAVSLSRSRS